MPCGGLSGGEPGFSKAVKKIGCLVEAFHNEGSRNNTVVCWSSDYLVERLVGLTDSTLGLCINQGWFTQSSSLEDDISMSINISLHITMFTLVT